MLFMLTGDIQIGKSRWLLDLVDALAAHGIASYGVIAPGVWVKSGGKHANADGFEKLGIDNVLLPQGEKVRFAQRVDLAKEQGAYSDNTQSARAGLGWHIDEHALARVNEHFADIAQRIRQGDRAGVLIVDELGRLELHRNGGLTEALHLLDRGPSESFADAIVVVRDVLSDDVERRLAPVWGSVQRIAPDEASSDLIMRQLL